ncbi:unnamed protein product [Meloidogyne enterolobii]|uniref:Uncharacterized protein n=1 Tax=Meloidogyne enterolobii TaxID=390850 RepID=A0ACB1AQ99_MELEN
MIIDKDKKEEFFEKIKTGFRGIEDYAQILCSAYGEELPQKVINKIREKYGGEEGKKFTEKEIVVDKLVQLRIPLLFEVKREGEIYKVYIKNYRGYFSFITGGGPAWYYVLVDKDKEVAFVEKSKTGKIVVEDYGKVLYSGWGEDAPKDIKDKMFKEYGVADYVEWYMI